MNNNQNSPGQGRRPSVGDNSLDLSGRSAASAGSLGSNFTAASNMMAYPSQQSATPFAFPPTNSPQQQQQRVFQMQMQQHQLQLQQLQRQNQQMQLQQQQQQQASPSNSYPSASSSQRRPTGANTGGTPNSSSNNNNTTNAAFGVPPQSNSAASSKQQQQTATRTPFPLPPPPLTAAASPPSQATTQMNNTTGAETTANQRSNSVASLNLNAQQQQQQQQQLPTEKVVALLSKCNWIDKTVWASRQLLGGQAVNGFLRATATVQRIKKQRARQNAKAGTGKKAAEGESTASLDEQQAEEELLKKEIMNARTAKKLKTELDSGIQFCVVLHDTIRSILQQIDSSLPPVEPLSTSSIRFSRNTAMTTTTSLTQHNKSTSGTVTANYAATTNSYNATGANSAPTTTGPLPPPSPLQKKQSISSASMPSSAGNSAGSTLRRHRKIKLPASGEPIIQLPEFDELTGKRTCTKKEHTQRLSEILRFRALRQGDPVAARVSSRDLWILARVVKDYPGTNMTPVEFLRLSESRREQVFKDKVLIQDVEEHDGGAAAAVLVSRALVLPLPRNVSEAAEWGSQYRFFKKGSRVYAMYPQTTSLYTATVVDCTTYCRGDEDIVVVEFDGDEPDSATGMIPACHIPARFVTLIPREFPGAQTTTAAAGSKRKRSSPVTAAANSDPLNGVLDDLNFEGDLPGLDNFDDLDFDLLGDS
jgi:SGF29 tudor-like domain